MPVEGATYSSAHLRERDKILEEKHRKEIVVIERKIERLKWSNNDTVKQLFEAQNRCRRLAQSLGFEDIYEAQVTIDTADHDATFKDSLERIHILEAELVAERNERESLKEKLLLAEEEKLQMQLELEKLSAEKQAKPSSANLKAQLAQLQAQYDALKDVKERAAERYKVDYKKWRDFSKWLFTEDDNHRKHRNEQGISATEKKKRDFESIMRKKQKMMELGPDLAQFAGEDDEDPKDPSAETTPTRHPPPIGRTGIEDDKENQEHQCTPGPLHKSQRISSAPNPSLVARPTPSTYNPQPLSISRTSAAPSYSPTIFLDPSVTSTHTTNTRSASTTRVPLSFTLIPNTEPRITIKKEPKPSPSLGDTLKRPHSPNPSPRIPNSSDTEEDSQAMSYPLKTTAQAVVFKIPAPLVVPKTLRLNQAGGSSDTEDDSQAPDPTPVPLRGHDEFPTFPPVAVPSTARQGGYGAIQPRRPDRLGVDNRPNKLRRVSGDEFGGGPSSNRPQHDTSSGTEDQGARFTPRGPDVKGKGKERQDDLVTPLTSRAAGQKRIDDYSAFKGRGRYAKGGEASTGKTINTLFVIDPAQNGGLDFQYDEVVRGKEQRRQMNAGDCECCRDYYEAVGPLPDRLQQPLWRSPSKTPLKSCSRRRHENLSSSDRRDGSSRQRDIDSHKKAISRHRHAWARASTPPGYWNIGFPNTQEVGDINEKAEEMHRKKRAQVEREAGSGVGKYRKR